MEICELKKEDEKAWDEYILMHPDSTFYHQIGWKEVVEKSYRHKPYYIIAKENGIIKGVLPLFLMESRIFGRKLVSLPFAPYGGACADDENTKIMLIKEAKTLTNKLKLDYLEFRNYKAQEIDLITNNSYFTLILKLDSNPMLLWNNFRKSMRRYIRQGQENNLVIESGLTYIKEFYDLYSQNMRNLGTPVHSRIFFNNLLIEFPENVNITIVRYNDNPIAAVLMLYKKDTIIYGWGGSDRKYLNYSPNYILFWELIQQSCERKITYFDFGRSQKDEGTFLFKTGWGAQPRQLHYQYYLDNSKHNPDLSKSNPNRQRFANLWKNLPYSLTNKLGPILRRNIP